MVFNYYFTEVGGNSVVERLKNQFLQGFKIIL